MIHLRRLAAIPLLVLVTVVLVATLVAVRANATVLDAGFLRARLRAIDAYHAIHDEVLPRALDRFLQDREAGATGALAAVALPTDAAARAVVTGLLRDAAPAERLATEVEAAIDALVP